MLSIPIRSRLGHRSVAGKGGKFGTAERANGIDQTEQIYPHAETRQRMTQLQPDDKARRFQPEEQIPHPVG